MLGIRRTRTTSYHPASNGTTERWHKDLHTGISHYINSANTNWDTIFPFFFYGAQSDTPLGYGLQPILFVAWQMQPPRNDSLKTRCVKENTKTDA